MFIIYNDLLKYKNKHPSQFAKKHTIPDYKLWIIYSEIIKDNQTTK